MSLIERNALLKKVYEHPQERERMTDGEWCRKCIYEAPTIEPEVRHGRWIPVDGEPYTKCSYCGEKHYGCTTPYCDMCGAYMRKVTGTNDGGKGGEQE